MCLKKFDFSQSLNVLPQVVQHPRDARLTVVLTIDVVEHIAYLLLRQPLAVQCTSQPLALFLLASQHREDARMEVAVLITRYPELSRYGPDHKCGPS